MFSKNLKRDISKTTAQQAVKKQEIKKPKDERNFGNQTSFKVYTEEIIEKIEKRPAGKELKELIKEVKKKDDKLEKLLDDDDASLLSEKSINLKN